LRQLVDYWNEIVKDLLFGINILSLFEKVKGNKDIRLFGESNFIGKVSFGKNYLVIGCVEFFIS
jgi:hypothetical protein